MYSVDRIGLSLMERIKIAREEVVACACCVLWTLDVIEW